MLSRRKRQNRPVDFGPYPLEGLRRDPSIIEEEANRRARTPKEITTGGSKYLVSAVRAHLEAYNELREPEPFSKKAPVPDQLPRRSADIKGAGYFLDASQVGIFKIPTSAWLGSTGREVTHAIVILVEYSDPIDSDNKAAGWVDGNAHLLSTLRAAEIATCISGQISSMGFKSKCHWTGATDIDLDKLTVLAGLAIREDDALVNPYLDGRFSVAVITTDYIVECDKPLHPDTRDGRDLSYQIGLSGAVSGLERWRRKRRPSHLGPYPVEDLKRIDRPTTLIIDDEVPRVPSRANFYVRTALGDLSKKAQGQANRWSQKQPVAQGIVRPMWGVKTLQEGQTASQMAADSTDAEENTKALKALCHYMGAAITGICEIPDYCWYSHDKRGQPIDPYHKYALTVLIDQGHETVLGASGNDWISGAQSMRSYLRGAEIVGVVAAMLREMGHPARAHSSLDSHVLHVPLVLLSGLGEQSRIGESALNPFLGMRFKTAVLTTDIPLVPDRPIDFGLQQFCGSCLKCARECPSQAIPYGDKVMFNGYETWKPDTERCTSYRATNLKGSSCGRCIHICPLTKDTTLDGPILHQLGSWLGVHAMWLKPVLQPIAIWLDDFLGYGNPIDAKKWWLDLEVMGDKSFKYDPKNFTVAAKEANRPMIDPKKKIPKEQKMAYYPASTLPPPDLMAAFPLDRKQGLKHAAEAETVEEALIRRANGGEKPATYIPSYESGEKKLSFSHPNHRQLETGQNISTTGEILDYAAQAHPDKTGLICGDRQWTFAELDKAANRFAHFVVDRLADREGPVGIMGKNSAEYAIAHFGTARTGRHSVNLHTRCTPKDLALAVNLTMPAMMIIDAVCRELVESAQSDFEEPPIQVFIDDEEPKNVSGFWGAFANYPDNAPEMEINPEDPGTVIFTGGTTGKPKAVLSSQRARAISAMAALEDFRISPDEVGGFSVPFSHAAGLTSWFQPAVLSGCTGVIIPKWDAELFMALTEQHKITTIFAVPAQLATLLDNPIFEPDRLRTLRRIVFGGAPLSKALIERIEAAMPWVSCERAYGSTETGHMAAQNKENRVDVYDGYNQPGGRLEIEIFKEPGIPATNGEIGEVAMRGPQLMTGYLEDPDAEAEFFRTGTTAGDWGWTGDLAEKHEGYFSLVGRSKHIILSGGMNIYPGELEEVLQSHPDVTDCAVIGIEDDTWGELPIAAIVSKNNDPDIENILEFTANNVARYKRVRQIVLVDHIPRTPAGKIQVHLVRELCTNASPDGS